MGSAKEEVKKKENPARECGVVEMEEGKSLDAADRRKRSTLAGGALAAKGKALGAGVIWESLAFKGHKLYLTAPPVNP